MPTYHFHCKKCDKHWEDTIKIAEMDIPLKKACPECKKRGGIERLIEAPKIVGGVDGQSSLRHDGAFKEVMAKVKENHPAGNWDNKTGGPNAYKEV